VIVHLFRAETRSFYDIERLWQMAPPPERGGLKVAGDDT